MSFDFQIIGHGSEARANYTSKVAPMFKAANPDEGIIVIQGMTAAAQFSHCWTFAITCFYTDQKWRP